ncbi:unnamed protein product [Sphagnum balticum]
MSRATTLQATMLPSLRPWFVRRLFVELSFDFRQTVLRPTYIIDDVTAGIIVLSSYVIVAITIDVTACVIVLTSCALLLCVLLA